MYGKSDDAESIATIHAALDRGVTLLDTGDFYGVGHNELRKRSAARRQCIRSPTFRSSTR
jgi:aryl-alcohol dehydrogenase-like predicted oxidoreductase